MPEPHSPPKPGTTPVASPVGERGRILEMDVARGFALLGIFLVNMQLFSRPLGEYITPGPPPGSSDADTAAYYAVKVLCEGKFYPLFSILFGMGIMAQAARADGAGRAFAPLFLRKQFLLAIIGALHAVLLWHGDILFIYAFAGLILLLVRRWKARGLLITACALLVVSTLLWAAFTSVDVVMDEAKARAAPQGASAQPAPAERASPPETAAESPAPAAAPSVPASPARRTALDALADGAPGEAFDPKSPQRAEADILAFRDGPYSHAVIMRLINWGTFLVVTVVALGWHILAMFFLGAGLMKAGVFRPENGRMVGWMMKVGLGVGLPLAALGAVAASVLPPWGGVIDAAAAHIAGPLVALGYLGAITTIVRSGRWRRVTGALAGAGRMALTVYLLESLLASAVFQHWGFAQFGEWARAPRLALAIGIYLALVLFANLWMRAFRMGPVEWLWRTGTYLRPQPLLRGDDARANPD